MNMSLENKVVVITGGAGLMGVKHGEAVAELNGIPILVDINSTLLEKSVQSIKNMYSVQCLGFNINITSSGEVKRMTRNLIKNFGKIDILINNAANNADVGKSGEKEFSRFENFPLKSWNDDVAVGLTGAFLCSQVIGSHMAKNLGGVILNISSDLGVIAPNQQIYAKDNIEENKQSVKPVTYSVVKHGLIGLTKYLATYWPDKNIRANSISPGGIYNGQSEDFVKKLTALIPMARMAEIDEYKAAILFLVSDASSYMNGANLIIDGGRTCW